MLGSPMAGWRPVGRSLAPCLATGASTPCRLLAESLSAPVRSMAARKRSGSAEFSYRQRQTQAFKALLILISSTLLLLPFLSPPENLCQKGSPGLLDNHIFTGVIK